jgi:hypothetical protein
MRRVGQSMLAVSILALLLASCTTIQRQEMVYLGDQGKQPSVVGEATHIDFAGVGVDGENYANDYQRAINDAFRKSPQGTTELKDVKAFKTPKSWPQVLGLGAVCLGAMLISESSDGGSTTLGAGLYLGGLVTMCVNTYDFVVVANPTN